MKFVPKVVLCYIEQSFGRSGKFVENARKVNELSALQRKKKD